MNLPEEGCKCILSPKNEPRVYCSVVRRKKKKDKAFGGHHAYNLMPTLWQQSIFLKLKYKCKPPEIAVYCWKFDS